MAEISVIVPVYKVEMFLSQCIKSILGQSFTDFELLLIDDGSPDLSGEICMEWAKKDSRIRVFHQKNSGVSAARNKGLSEAQGKYVVFVDSDDWVFPNYLEHLYALAGKGLVMQGYIRCNEDGVLEKEINAPKNGKYDLYDSETFFKGEDVDYLTSPWSKIFDLQLIKENRLCFDEQIHYGEDTLFVYSYILCCEFIVTAESADYVYRKLSSSLSTKINSFHSEYIFFKKQYAFICELAHRLDISPRDMHKLLKFSLFYFQRALRTDYLSYHPISRTARIAHIKQLVRENRQYVDIYYQPDYKLDKIGRFLLRMHQFAIYDFCFKFLFRLKVRQVFLGGT